MVSDVVERLLPFERVHCIAREIRAAVQRLRAQASVVLTGADTVLADVDEGFDDLAVSGSRLVARELPCGIRREGTKCLRPAPCTAKANKSPGRRTGSSVQVSYRKFCCRYCTYSKIHAPKCESLPHPIRLEIL